MKITLQGWKCNRCGWEWFSRNKAAPVCCAKCKSPYWDKPQKKKAKS